MFTNVYIDGFNLYYGAIKGKEFHWLDLSKMCGMLLPGHNIGIIRYFTAIVSGRSDDPDKPIRQQIYLRALATLPNVTVSLGKFTSHKVKMPLVRPLEGGAKLVKVWKTEEKGSDVNIATNLLHDAHCGRFEIAVVISNDSDLLEPIKIARRELGKKIGIINPRGQQPSRALMQQSDFIRQLRDGVLRESQFPETLTDSSGEFSNPFKLRPRATKKSDGPV